MDQKNQILFALLRSAIRGTKLTEEELNNYSPEWIQDLFKISSKHDVAHLLAYGLKENGLIPNENAEIEKYIFNAVYRYQRLKYEYDKMCAALEKAQIPFLPLKGSVIRKYYPEPWMRTSCDIDILVHKEDVEKAGSVLIDECGCVYHEKTTHDVSFFTSTNVHVELHHLLVEGRVANNSSKILENVWNMSALREGHSFWHEMTDDLYYFYHIAHMAKHFEHGGCGIRPFIDLWILDNIQGADVDKRDKLLEEGNLLKFADSARNLSKIWLENKEYDFVSEQMENYILSGGAYGTGENRIVVQEQLKGGRFKYVLFKIFLPYDVIKYHYPILQKHKWLTPFMEVRRWFKLIFRGNVKRSINELKDSQNISSEKANEMKQFLTSIGL